MCFFQWRFTVCDRVYVRVLGDEHGILVCCQPIQFIMRSVLFQTNNENRRISSSRKSKYVFYTIVQKKFVFFTTFFSIPFSFWFDFVFFHSVCSSSVRSYFERRWQSSFSPQTFRCVSLNGIESHFLCMQLQFLEEIFLFFNLWFKYDGFWALLMSDSEESETYTKKRDILIFIISLSMPKIRKQ